MIYLLIGEDGLTKDQKIAEIKKKSLPLTEALQFDCDLLHATKLDPDDLKKSLLSLPSFAARRLVIIRSLQKLSPHNKEILLEFINQKPNHVDLILDTDENNPQDKFWAQILVFAKVVHSENASQKNVFDMTRAIERHQAADALLILSELVTQGTHPLQIMGGLVWFWGKLKSRLSSERFQQGLEMLQEADLNIKRSRLEPEFAVETAVVKLMGIL